MSSVAFFCDRGVNVSRETFSYFENYYEVLLVWQKKINLISNCTIDQIWERHFLDSSQLNNYIFPSEYSILDIGSGAGFPGMVIAMMREGQITLIESNQKKISFLNHIKRLNRVSVTLLPYRIEDITSLQVQVIMARAVTKITTLLTYAHLHLKSDGKCLFLKGKEVEAEIEEAYNKWNFTFNLYSSITNKTGVIIEIKNIEKREVN